MYVELCSYLKEKRISDVEVLHADGGEECVVDSHMALVRDGQQQQVDAEPGQHAKSPDEEFQVAWTEAWVLLTAAHQVQHEVACEVERSCI